MLSAPAGTITVNGDAGNADATPQTIIQLLGQLSSLNTIQVNGGAGNDQLTLNPSGTGSTAIDLRGAAGNDQYRCNWATCRASSRSWIRPARPIT